MENRKIVIRFQVVTKNFSLLQRFQTGFGNQKISNLMGAGGKAAVRDAAC